VFHHGRRRRLVEHAERFDPGGEPALEAIRLGAVIMLGTLLGLTVLIFALVLRYDPEARSPSKSKRRH